MPSSPFTLLTRPSNLLLTQLAKAPQALEKPCLMPFTIFLPISRKAENAPENTPLICCQMPEKKGGHTAPYALMAFHAPSKSPERTAFTVENMPLMVFHIMEKKLVTVLQTALMALHAPENAADR